MPLQTLFISGPARVGKTTVAEVIARDVLNRPVHHLRLRPSSDRHTNVVEEVAPEEVGGDPSRWASAHLVRYTADRIFETLPEGLRAIRKKVRTGFTVIEAEADASLRHAYPYDYRLFVMAPPQEIHQVFRDSRASAEALRQVMQDTATFASEIFGVAETGGLEDSAAGMMSPGMDPEFDDSTMESMDIGDIQLRQFLDSPLGAEIACRIQLHPEYYALVESDVAVINTAAREAGPALHPCVKRVETLLSRVRQEARRHSVLYWGDVANPSDPARQQLISRLQTLLCA